MSLFLKINKFGWTEKAEILYCEETNLLVPFGGFLEACKQRDAMWLIFSVARVNNLFLVLLKYQFGNFE